MSRNYFSGVSNHNLFYATLLMLLFFLFSGCGGSKKAVVPDTTPETTKVEEPKSMPTVTEEVTKPEALPKKATEFVLKTVYFDYDKSDIRSDTRKTLIENANMLKEHNDVKIIIEGHCDERGTVEYNLALGDRRANSVKSYLIDLGISPDRIKTVSYGKERPVDLKRTEEAYSRNRRVEFVRSSPLAMN